MNKVIVNGIDISEAVNKLEKVKSFIEVVKKSDEMHRSKAFKYINSNKELSQFHFGFAESCQATINDLELILEVKND